MKTIIECVGLGIFGFFLMAGIGAGYGLMDAMPKWIEKHNKKKDN